MFFMVYKRGGISYHHKKDYKYRKTVPPTFSRSGVAWDSQGQSVAANTPRYNSGGGVLVEEAVTNLLTADASLSILNAAPYTTGTLNGTYTFSCKTGNIVLSGGTTGTVVPGTPLTKTVSSATVTLTPDTAATYNQVTLTAYPLEWTLGGTTKAAEVCSVNSGVLNIDQRGYSNLLTANQSNLAALWNKGSENGDATHTIANNIGTFNKGPTSSYSYCMIQPAVTITPGTTFTFSVNFKNDTGAGEVGLKMNAVTTNFTLDGSGVPVTKSITRTFSGSGSWTQLDIVLGSFYGQTNPLSTVNFSNAQLTQTSDSRDWILGGTSVNNGEGTIEAEIYINTPLITTPAKYIFDANGTGYIRLYHSTTDVFKADTNNGATTDSITSGAYATGLWLPVSVAWKQNLVELDINGVNIGTATNNRLPTVLTSMNIGALNTGASQADTYIRKFTVSNRYRSFAERQARAQLVKSGGSFPVDRYVTAHLPLINDLRGVSR